MVHSAKYNNAPMPHAIFFYGQYAIHGTNAVGALGSPASHGCIRLSPQHAALLFAMVQSEGAEIRIEGASAGPCRSRPPRRGGGARLRACAPPALAQGMGPQSGRPLSVRTASRHVAATFVSHGTARRAGPKGLSRRVFAGRLFRRLALSGRRPGSSRRRLVRRREFLVGAAGGLLGAACAVAAGAGQRADALFARPQSADGQPGEVHRLGRRPARRGSQVPRRAVRPVPGDGPQRGSAERPPQARVPADARGKNSFCSRTSVAPTTTPSSTSASA